MAQVEIIDTATPGLLRLAQAAGDFSEPMRVIAGQLETASQFNFLNQKSPLGVPWVKRAAPPDGESDPGHPLLRLSGDLMSSIKGSHGPMEARAGPEASGGAAKYAAIHQFGGKITPKTGRALSTPWGYRGAVTIPARPYLGWNEQMKRNAVATIKGHIERMAAGGGA